MKRFANIKSFQRFLVTTLPVRINAGKQAGLEAAGVMIATEMRGELGAYQGGDAGFEDWAPLAPGTLEGFHQLPGKIADGHAPPDNPLKASGALEASISHQVDEDRVVIGSTDPVAIYQDKGTDKRGIPFVSGATTAPGIPAREFVGRAGFRKAPEAAEAIGAAIIREMVKP